MAKKNWKFVRVTDETFRKLKEISQKLEATYVRGSWTNTIECSDRFGVTMDTVIGILCDRDNSHRNRSNQPGS